MYKGLCLKRLLLSRKRRLQPPGYTTSNLDGTALNLESLGRATRVRCFATLVLLVCAGTGLVGCAGQPISSPSMGPTIANTVAGKGRNPLPPPTSESQALLEARQAVDADQGAIFAVFQGKLSGQSLSKYEAGQWLKYMTKYVDAIGDESGVVGVSGHPNLWAPNPSRSKARTLHLGSQAYAFGSVQMTGCFHDLGSLVYSSDAPTPSAAMPSLTPARVDVQYQPSGKLWFVTNVVYLPDDSRSKACP